MSPFLSGWGGGEGEGVNGSLATANKPILGVNTRVVKADFLKAVREAVD